MAETVNGKSFADMIRMMAKSIYDDADDIAGKTEGCTEIEISFDIETAGYDTEFPTYTVTRRHYPRKYLIEDFIRMRGASETKEETHPVLSIDSDPVAYKEMLDAANKSKWMNLEIKED